MIISLSCSKTYSDFWSSLCLTIYKLFDFGPAIASSYINENRNSCSISWNCCEDHVGNFNRYLLLSLEELSPFSICVCPVDCPPWGHACFSSQTYACGRGGISCGTPFPWPQQLVQRLDIQEEPGIAYPWIYI